MIEICDRGNLGKCYEIELIKEVLDNISGRKRKKMHQE